MNIEFHHENLFDSEVQVKWKDTILKSAFIFLDIDPHDGKLELEFYHNGQVLQKARVLSQHSKLL
jgi:hypothetical protein